MDLIVGAVNPSNSPQSPKTLLSIVELGGYPSFTPLYQDAGFHVVIETNMRKALRRLKNTAPAVIVAEFNYQSDFRDRTSSLESLLARVQQMPDTKVIVFYDKDFAHQFAKLRARFRIFEALPFPIERPHLAACLGASAH
jgi:hypothetical protein